VAGKADARGTWSRLLKGVWLSDGPRQGAGASGGSSSRGDSTWLEIVLSEGKETAKNPPDARQAGPQGPAAESASASARPPARPPARAARASPSQAGRADAPPPWPARLPQTEPARRGAAPVNDPRLVHAAVDVTEKRPPSPKRTWRIRLHCPALGPRPSSPAQFPPCCAFPGHSDPLLGRPFAPVRQPCWDERGEPVALGRGLPSSSAKLTGLLTGAAGGRAAGKRGGPLGHGFSRGGRRRSRPRWWPAASGRRRFLGGTPRLAARHARLRRWARRGRAVSAGVALFTAFRTARAGRRRLRISRAACRARRSTWRATTAAVGGARGFRDAAAGAARAAGNHLFRLRPGADAARTGEAGGALGGAMPRLVGDADGVRAVGICFSCVTRVEDGPTAGITAGCAVEGPVFRRGPGWRGRGEARTFHHRGTKDTKDSQRNSLCHLCVLRAFCGESSCNGPLRSSFHFPALVGPVLKAR